MRFLVYIAVAFIVFQVVRGLQRKSSSPRPPNREKTGDDAGTDSRYRQVDYQNVKDADFRDLQ